MIAKVSKCRICRSLALYRADGEITWPLCAWHAAAAVGCGFTVLDVHGNVMQYADVKRLREEWRLRG